MSTPTESMLPFSAAANVSASTATVVELRCPKCGKQGAFHGTINTPDLTWRQPLTQANKNQNVQYSVSAGVRICPAPTCKAPIFVILTAGQVLQSYPPEVLDFDATALPAEIASSLEESVKCHASGCYRAAALMVRRVLEEVCQDKNAQGKDLKQRLGNLGGAILVPKELLDAADELRVLGNDAAHIEAKAYDRIDRTEAEIAIDLAKELLKAVYQYTSLVDRLRALKRPPTP